MRTLDSSAIDLLTSGQEIEPVAIIAVTWTPGSTPLYYADRIVDGLYDGRILEMGSLDLSQRSDSSGLAGAVTVKLDDRDGALKSILDTEDIHLIRVDCYQWFWGLEDTDKFLLFSGQISTPIIWDEGSRSLTFDVVTKIEDQEVGWSAEMGNYATVAQELVGVPWPLVFGTVQHVPALQLQNIPTGFTTAPFGIPDKTVGSQITSLETLLAEAIDATEFYSLQVVDEGGSTENILDDPNVQQYTQMQATIQNQITALQGTSDWQLVLAVSSVGIIPTVTVNQPFSGIVRVNNSLFNATINGNQGTLSTVPVLLPGAPADTTVRQGYQFFNAGSQVVIADNYPIQYVASVVPGTVLKVWAMRSFNGIKQLSVVPPDYYTVSTQAMSGFLTATYVTLKQPLSTIALIQNLKTQIWENDFGKSLPPHIVNQIDWEDKLYVTFQSSVGPNPVDIMIWLISNYTSNGYDSASFSSVSAQLAGFPMNFMLAEQPNVLDLLNEIAYQARCLLFLRDDVFYLIFWPANPTPVDTITEDDIAVGSMQVVSTPTEALVTKYTATYRPDYSPFYDKPVQVILRYNIPKYGTHAETHDFYCYNDFYSVEKAATYWLIMKSQSWKVLKAKLLLNKINLEAFDYVTLHFAQPYIASVDVIGFIQSANYNSDDKTIDVEIWCPVLLGTTVVNPFAYPVGATEIDIWPQFHNEAGGGGASISQPSLPPANSTRLPIGVIDGFAFIEDNSGVGGPGLRQSWDSGDPFPGATELTPSPIPQPADQVVRWTPLPATDPTLDYTYPTPPNPTIMPSSGMYPGVIQDKIGPDSKNGNLINYHVNVYENGLMNQAKTIVAGQLQIDPDDVIPPGSWWYISYRAGVDQNGNSYSEKTFQIPVWLT